MSGHLRKAVAGGSGYLPGEQPRAGEHVIKLNTNENPWPPSPAALAAARAAVSESLRLYPEPTHRALRRAIAGRYGVDPDRVVLGNGSDEILALLLRACVEPGDKVAAARPTYTLYRTLAALHGAVFEEHPFRMDGGPVLPGRQPVSPGRQAGDFDLPESLAGTDARLVFLCNPNSPSGTALPVARLEALAEALPGLLVVDEAYVEFGAEPALELAMRRDDVVVVRTLSKSHSLAGLRVGWALAPADLAAGLDRVRDSYNLDRVAQAAAEAAIQDVEHLAANTRRVVEARERLSVGLGSLGFFVWPSRANFVLARWKESAAGLARDLRERGILVRHFAEPGLDDCLRVSVGRPEEVEAFLGALKDMIHRG